jgi:hypothetical protein
LPVSKPFFQWLVGMIGLEPTRLSALVPKTSVYTNFTTSPRRSRGAGLRKRALLLTPASIRFLLSFLQKYCTAEFRKNGKATGVFYSFFDKKARSLPIKIIYKQEGENFSKQVAAGRGRGVSQGMSPAVHPAASARSFRRRGCRAAACPTSPGCWSR